MTSAVMTTTTEPNRWLVGSTPRRAIATAAVMAGVGLLLTVEAPVAAIPVAALSLSAVLLHRDHAGAQLLARAIWLAVLLPATAAVLFAGIPTWAALPVALAAALVVMGRRGLGESSGFRPKVLRRTFLGALGIGMVNAVWMLGAAATGLMNGVTNGTVAMLAAAAVALMAGSVGLYRMRLWGLLAIVATNLAVLGLSISSTELFATLIPLWGLSAVQLATLAPAFYRIARPRALSSGG